MGIALAILANLLILLLLLDLAPGVQFLSMARHGPLTVQLLPEARTQSAGGRAVKRAEHKATSAARARSAARPPVPPPPIPQKPDQPLNMLMLSREDYVASDISKLPSRRAEQQAAVGNPGAGAGSDSASSSGNGGGAGGERLFDAEWYREPTHAELATYLPRTATDGAWGMVACQTVERFHVDNCRELDGSPGSGMARAVREAAWQFLVRPPRVGGRPMVGAWVRIRIDITATGIDHH